MAAIKDAAGEQATKRDAAQDPCTPPHTLIAAVHQQSAPATRHRTPLALSSSTRAEDGDVSKHTSPPTIYCTPRLQLQAAAPRSVLLQLEVGRFTYCI